MPFGGIIWAGGSFGQEKYAIHNLQEVNPTKNFEGSSGQEKYNCELPNNTPLPHHHHSLIIIDIIKTFSVSIW